MKHISKTTLAALALILASSAGVNAQEVRDPNQAPKKFEAAVGVRNIHGYAGRVWIPDPYIVGEIGVSTETKPPHFLAGGYIGKLVIQGFSWFGVNPQNGNSEMDLGGSVIKDFSLYGGKIKFSLGLQGAVYSIPIHGEAESNSNLEIIARVPISKNWGVSFTKDIRKLSSYSVGTGYNIPLENLPVFHDGSITLRGEFRDSYTFGPTANASATLGLGPVYVTGKIMKGFHQRPEEKHLDKAVPMVEGGLRWQF